MSYSQVLIHFTLVCNLCKINIRRYDSQHSKRQKIFNNRGLHMYRIKIDPEINLLTVLTQNKKALKTQLPKHLVYPKRLLLWDL